MSLVNDMLRDLNRRKSLPVQVTRINGAIDTRIDARRSRSGFVLLALGVAVGVGSAWLLIQNQNQIINRQLVLPQVATPAASMPAAELPAPAPPVIEQPAPVTFAIAEEALSPEGFTLRIQASAPADFAITDRREDGLTLHLDGIDRFEGEPASIDGVSVLITGDGANVELNLAAPSDFVVAEDATTEAFDIILKASYRPRAVDLVAAAPAPVVDGYVTPPAALPDDDMQLLDRLAAEAELSALLPSAPYLPPQTLDQVPATPTVPASERNVPVRTTRGLTLEEQDRSTSQTAASMVRGGRLFEAYEKLLTFITSNPSAHQSRETLATVLLAQQEFAQAAVVIDEGLKIAPNHAPYKKIKARLLMRDSDANAALELMRSVPPSLAIDPEYHELLASLYQQTNNHRQAVEAYQGLLRLNSQQGRWWAGLGVSLEAQGNKTDALSSYQAALQAANLDAGLRQYSQGRIRSLSAQQ